MNKEPLVSVIVPVYEPGPHIDACLLSLTTQTLQPVEFLFVDDRGDDDTMEKVRAAAEKDARIRILTNEKNLGAGPSRNRGIEAAKGEYLAFVDADDSVAPDFLERLYTRAAAEDLDIVKGVHASRTEGEPIEAAVVQTKSTRLIRDGLDAQRPLWKLFNYEHQAALYRRLLVLQSGARYGAARISQDTTFLLQITHAARSFALEESAVYYYLRREDSAFNSISSDRLAAQLFSMQERVRWAREHLLTDATPGDYYSFLYEEFLTLLRLQVRLCVLPGRAREAEHFLEEIRQEAQRLPEKDILVLKYEVFAALLSHGFNLSYSPLRWAGIDPGVADCLHMIATWRAYLEMYPEKSRHPYLLNAWRTLLKEADTLCERATDEKDRLLLRQATEEALLSWENIAPLITVIVPISDGEETSSRFLSSLLVQRYTRFECLLVVAATEPAMRRAEAFSRRDGRLRIVVSKDPGEAALRNRGIEEAKGDYLTFLDPQDRIPPNYLQFLCRRADALQAPLAVGSLLSGSAAPPEGYNDRRLLTLANRRAMGEPLYCQFTEGFRAALYHRSLFEDSSVRFDASAYSEASFLLAVTRTLSSQDQMLLCTDLVYRGAAQADPLPSTEELAAQRRDLEAFLTHAKERIGQDPFFELYARRFCQDFLRRLDALSAEASRKKDLLSAILGVKAFEKKLLQNVSVPPEKPAPVSFAPVVSVITPFYRPNRDDLLRCLASLQAQTLKEIEMIFVDDCSGDDSADVLAQAALCDPRIRVVRNRADLGPGPSRNLAMALACGEYLAFVDPDDAVSEDFLELLVKKARAEQLDVVKGYAREYVNDAHTWEIPFAGGLNKSIVNSLEAGNPLFVTFYYEFYTALYRRAFLERNAIRFGVTRKAEDLTFLLRVGLGNPAFGLEPAAIYHYTIRTDSSSRRFTDEYLSESLAALVERLTQLQSTCPDSPFAYRCIAEDMRRLLATTEHCLSIPELTQAVEACRRKLYRLALSLPYRKELEEALPPLQAFFQHQLPLVTRVLGMKGIQIYPTSAQLARHWVNYLLAFPKERSILLPHFISMLCMATHRELDRMRQANLPPASTDLAALFAEVRRFQDGQGKALPAEDAKPLVSVILPVYEAALIIGRILFYWLFQTAPNFELLCIDDGSDDGSMEVVRAAAGTDPRVRILTPLLTPMTCDSLNVGLDAARGKYVYVADSFDYPRTNFLQDLCAKDEKEEADLIFVQHAWADGSELRQFSAMMGRQRSRRPLYDLPTDYPRAILYRRQFLQEHGLRFLGTAPLRDTCFMRQALSVADTVLCAPELKLTIGKSFDLRPDVWSASLARDLLAALETRLAFARACPDAEASFSLAKLAVRDALCDHLRLTASGVSEEILQRHLQELRAQAASCFSEEELSPDRLGYDLFALLRFGVDLAPPPPKAEPAEALPYFLQFFHNAQRFLKDYPEEASAFSGFFKTQYALFQKVVSETPRKWEPDAAWRSDVHRAEQEALRLLLRLRAT